ncbi:hypothetical protein [Herbaspirillum huttiense]|uniref:hypothetical protein n=1 Tax=Herbaspirillum huttiense TaxID=863372 RepID=UPI003F379BAF
MQIGEPKIACGGLRQRSIGWRIASCLGFCLMVLGPVVLLVAFAFLDHAAPEAHEVYNPPSPDGKWIATLELVDNGQGLGQGMVYDEVHLHSPSTAIKRHGESGGDVIFYANAGGETLRRSPQLTWVNSKRLLVTYCPERIDGGMPGKALMQYEGVQIEYRRQTNDTQTFRNASVE